MGAYLLLFPRSRVITLIPLFFLPLFVEIPAVTFLGFWALSQIFSGVLSLGLPEDVGGVAFWAHVGGFISGAALCWFFLRSKKAMRPLAPDEWGLEAAWQPLKTTGLTGLWRN
jgi:membrane associated rhomboid family serine protease